MSMSRRRNAILTFIVGDYITTASPIPSNAVAVESGLQVSSATIRNEMMALCEEGYLIRPHASSGAVPSEKGYRHFVDGLDKHSNPPRDFISLLHEQMDFGTEDIDAWVQVTSSIIADLIGALAFITAPRRKSSGVKGVELLRLHDMLIMLVIIMYETRVYRQIIELEQSVTDNEVEHTRNSIKSAISGKELYGLTALGEEHPKRNDFERQVWEAVIGVLKREEAAPGERYVNGVRHFFSEPENMAHPESGAMALSALESDDAFATLASEMSDTRRPMVFIGSDNSRPELQDFSVIMRGYGQETDARGIVGLISPMRIAYDRAIPVVSYTAQTIDSILCRTVHV